MFEGIFEIAYRPANTRIVRAPWEPSSVYRGVPGHTWLKGNNSFLWCLVNSSVLYIEYCGDNQLTDSRQIFVYWWNHVANMSQIIIKYLLFLKCIYINAVVFRWRKPSSVVLRWHRGPLTGLYFIISLTAFSVHRGARAFLRWGEQFACRIVLKVSLQNPECCVLRQRE